MLTKGSKNEIEYGIEEFIASLPLTLTNCDVDYVGIDLQGDGISYKVYIGAETKDVFCKDGIGSVKESIREIRKYILPNIMNERNMIFRIETILDSRKECQGRYDIAIENRTNENMEWLHEWLKKAARFTVKHEDLLNKLRYIRISDDPDYKQAALYHLGINERDSVIHNLKLYYFLGFQNKPVFDSTKVEYLDNEYLKFIESCGLKFTYLKNIVEDVLKKCGGHLWMMAIDMSEKGVDKYKIYLKKTNGIYDYLKTAFKGIYREKIEQIEKWESKNDETKLRGLAVGTDNLENICLNFYFTTNI